MTGPVSGGFKLNELAGLLRSQGYRVATQGPLEIRPAFLLLRVQYIVLGVLIILVVVGWWFQKDNPSATHFKIVLPWILSLLVVLLLLLMLWHFRVRVSVRSHSVVKQSIFRKSVFVVDDLEGFYYKCQSVRFARSGRIDYYTAFIGVKLRSGSMIQLVFIDAPTSDICKANARIALDALSGFMPKSCFEID